MVCTSVRVSVVTTFTSISCCSKIQNGLTFWYCHGIPDIKQVQQWLMVMVAAAAAAVVAVAVVLTISLIHFTFVVLFIILLVIR